MTEQTNMSCQWTQKHKTVSIVEENVDVKKILEQNGLN